MSTTTGDRLLTDYLARLDAAALRLPPDRRAELMEGIAEHVAEARAAGELRDEAAVRRLLARLGGPEEIVAAASEELPGGGGPTAWGGGGAPQLVPHRPGTALETAAVLMLTVGSFLPVVGWLVGVVLLWTSRRWRAGEKLLATLVVPGGPGLLLLWNLLSVRSCTSSFSSPAGVDTGGALVPPQDPTGPGALVPETAPPGLVLTPPAPGTETTVCEGGVPLPDWLVVTLLLAALVAPFVIGVVLLRRARQRAAAEPPVMRAVGSSSWTGLEIAAVVVLGVGTFVVPLLGTVVGLVLVWMSPRWTTSEKTVATALVLLPVALIALSFGAAAAGVALFAVGLIGAFLLFAFGPLIAAGYLALVLHRREVG